MNRNLFRNRTRVKVSVVVAVLYLLIFLFLASGPKEESNNEDEETQLARPKTQRPTTPPTPTPGKGLTVIIQKVFKIVSNGQLEFIGGGWVQNDEAVANYYDVVDQMTHGHMWLKDNLNVTIRYGWQVDPFGHSSSTPGIYNQFGIKAMVGSRITVAERERLRSQGDMQFVWEGSGSTLGDSRMFTHLLCEHYDYIHPVYYPMSFEEKNPDFTYAGQRFLESVMNLRKSYKSSNVLMVPWGTDFGFREQKEFNINNKFIDYLQTKKADYGIDDIRYGTLSEYFELAAKTTSQTQSFKLFKQDFFPYATGQQPWSGFYSTHSLFKKQTREVSATLRNADSFFALAMTKAKSFDDQSFSSLSSLYRSLEEARGIVGMMQHHDSVTGTARSYVMNDYKDKLNAAQAMSIEALVNSIDYIININSTSDKPLEFHRILDLDAIKSANRPLSLVFSNPLGAQQKTHYSIRVLAKDSILLNHLSIHDSRGQVVQFQSIPAALSSDCQSSDNPNKNEHHIYLVITVPALGIQTYFLTIGSSSSNSHMSTISEYESSDEFVSSKTSLVGKTISATFKPTGFIDSITKTIDGVPVVIKVDSSINQYTTSRSGAYIFFPGNKVEYLTNSQKITYFVVKGPLMEQVILYIEGSKCNPVSIIQHRIYKNPDQEAYPLKSEETVELGYSLLGDPNRETVFNFNTDIKSSHTFFTDNGLETRVRKVENLSPDIAYHYYPTLNSANMKDDKYQFTIFTERSQGVTSPVEGGLEIMVHRNLQQDDIKGLGLPNYDKARVDGRLFIGYDAIDNIKKNQFQYNLHLANKPIMMIKKIESIDLYQSQHMSEYSFLNAQLPESLHLSTLKYHKASQQVLMRVVHLQPQFSSQSQKQHFDINTFFNADYSIESFHTTQLNFQPKSTEDNPLAHFPVSGELIVQGENGLPEYSSPSNLMDSSSHAGSNVISISPLETKSLRINLVKTIGNNDSAKEVKLPLGKPFDSSEEFAYFQAFPSP
eukprot:gene13702-16148_t